MVLFAGPGATARAELTRDILAARFAKVGLKADEIRMDYVGHNSVHRAASPPPAEEPYEVVLRVAVKTTSRHEAAKLRREVDPLAVNGPAATGKWGTSAPGIAGPCLRRSEFMSGPARRGRMDRHDPHG